MCVPNLTADPFVAVGLAGKRIRVVPIEDAPEAIRTANENRDSPGIAVVAAPAYDIASTMASMPGWLGLAYSRGRLQVWAAVAISMPGHESCQWR
jgi:hypothetical protein